MKTVTIITIKVGNIIGDKTQNQLQSITFNNFKTMNAIVNNPVNPIPETMVLLFSFSLDIILIFYFFIITKFVAKNYSNSTIKVLNNQYYIYNIR